MKTFRNGTMADVHPHLRTWRRCTSGRGLEGDAVSKSRPCLVATPLRDASARSHERKIAWRDPRAPKIFPAGMWIRRQRKNRLAGRFLCRLMAILGIEPVTSTDEGGTLPLS